MSRIEVSLLCAMFAGSLLVEVRLPGLGISAANLCVPLCAVALAWLRRDALNEALASHRSLLIAAAVVYVWAWISALNGDAPALSIRYVVKYAAHLVVFVALLIFLHRRSTTEQAQRMAYGGLLALGALGVVEYFFPQSPFFTFFRRQPEAHPRLASLMIWPNQFAVLMAIAVAWGGALVSQRRIAAVGFYVAAPVLLTVLALSGGRSGWLALAVLFAALVVARVVSAKIAAVMTASFAVALLTFGVPRAQLGLFMTRPALDGSITAESDDDPDGTSPPMQTLGARLRLWRAALVEIERRPISGIGLETFANRIGPQVTGAYWINTHNLFLNIAVELGLVGAALVAVFVYVLLRSGNLRDWSTTIPLLGVAVGQIFDCFTYDHAFMAFVVFFAASYASLPNRKDQFRRASV